MLINRRSLAFLFYLFLAMMGALQTYTTFPIEENSPLKGASYWMPFMKVFRFALLGDFDIFELEGVDGVIKGKMHKGNLDAELDDGEVSWYFRSGTYFET